MADSTASVDVVPGSDRPAEESAEKWNSKYQQARMARLNFEQKWYTYLAFVAGKQYIQWVYGSTMATGRMIEPTNPNARVRIVINKTRRIMRRELARLNKEGIRGYVTPTNTDDNSQAAARGAEQVADYLTTKLKLQWRFKQADWWMLICGTAFLKDYYDETVQMGYAKTTDPETGQETQEQVFGSPVVEVISPFHLLVPNLDEPDIQKQPWIMHISMKSPEDIKARFPDADVGEGVSVSTNTLESRLLNIQGMTQDADKSKAVELREIWIRKCSNYPQGARITCTQERILEKLDEFPYAHGEYPFTKRTYIENSIFYGVTLVEDLMGLQVEYNRTRSQLMEDKNRMGRPQLAIELGSVDIAKLKGQAGEVVVYKPGSKPPQPIQIAGLPAYIIDHVNRIGAEMAELASQENQDGNSVPNGVTAATAIAYLQENQDALIMDTLRDKEMAWESVLQHLLSYVGQYWDSQRLITVSGDNNAFESFLFSQSDLQGQTEWRAIIGSSTPMSHSAKQAQIMELMKMGAVQIPQGLQFMELGDTARLYEDMQIDSREAKKENIRIRNGTWTSVELYQEHLQHLMEHDNVRKREEYDVWTPESKAMMTYHAYLHMYQFLTEMGQQVMLPPEMTQEAENTALMMQQNPGFKPPIPTVPPYFESSLRAMINALTMGQMQATSEGPAATTPE